MLLPKIDVAKISVYSIFVIVTKSGRELLSTVNQLFF